MHNEEVKQVTAPIGILCCPRCLALLEIVEMRPGVYRLECMYCGWKSIYFVKIYFNTTDSTS